MKYVNRHVRHQMIANGGEGKELARRPADQEIILNDRLRKPQARRLLKYLRPGRVVWIGWFR